MRRTRDQLQKLSNSPLLHELRLHPPKSNAELQEQIRKFSESTSVQKVGELLRGFADKPEEETPPPKRRKRSAGAGRPHKLTNEEVERGIELLLSHQTLAPKVAFEVLRKAGIGRNVNDATLSRRITNVARDRRPARPRS
jgi:hypothetical protein